MLLLSSLTGRHLTINILIIYWLVHIPVLAWAVRIVMKWEEKYRNCKSSVF